MSIVRIGLAQTKNFAEGYDAIFRKKKKAEPKKEAQAADKKKKPAKGKKK